MSAKTSHRRMTRAMRPLETHEPLDLNAWSVVDAFGIQHTIYTLDEQAPEGFANARKLDA